MSDSHYDADCHKEDKKMPRILMDKVLEHVNLAFPVICTFILRRSTDILSVVAVGHIGPHYLAAAGLATVTANVTGNSMIIGLAGALSTLCSQAFGAKDMRELGLSLQRSFLILGCFICLPVSFLWRYSASLMVFLGQNHEIAMDAQNYMCTLIPAMWALAVSMCIQNWLYAQSNARSTAIITIIVATLHPLWLYIYIYQLDIGFLGAAMAVSTSKVVEVVLLLLYVNCVSTVLIDTEFRWSWDCLQNWWSFIRLGMPNLLLLAEWWASEAIIFMSGSLPGDSDVNVSTMSVYQNLLAFCFMIPIGLHIAAATIVGNALGAGAAKEAAISSCIAPSICIFVMVLVVVCIILPLGSQVGRIFTDDPQVIAELVTLIPVMGAYVVMDGLQTSLTGVLKGMGRQASGVPVVLFCYVIIAVPLAAYLAMPDWGLGMGVLGLAIGTLVGTVVHGLCFSLLIFCLTDWEKETARIRSDREKYSLVAANKSSKRTSVGNSEASIDALECDLETDKSKMDKNNKIVIRNPMIESDPIVDNSLSNVNGKDVQGGDPDVASWWDEISFLGDSGSITAIRGSKRHSQQQSGGSLQQLHNISLGAYNRIRLLFGAKLKPSEYELVKTYTDSLSPRHMDADDDIKRVHSELDFDFL